MSMLADTRVKDSAWGMATLGLVFAEHHHLQAGIRELLQQVAGVGADATPEGDGSRVEANPHKASRMCCSRYVTAVKLSSHIPENRCIEEPHFLLVTGSDCKMCAVFHSERRGWLC